jgi:hypothetical protein
VFIISCMEHSVMTSAQQFCQQVQQAKHNMSEFGQIVKSALSPLEAIGNLINSVPSKTSSTETISTNITNVVSSRIINNIESSCANSAIVNQGNTVDNTACMAALNCGNYLEQAKAYAAIGYTPDQATQLIAKNNDVCLAIANGNITQVNSLTAQQNCTLDGMIQVLSQAKLDANLTAILQKALEAKGLLSSSSSATNDCTSVSNTVSSDVYTSSLQSCVQKLQLNQPNVANCKGGTVSQTNTANMLQQCMQNNGVNVSANTSGASTTNTASMTSQKSSGFSLSLFSSQGVMIALGVIVVLVLMTRKPKPPVSSITASAPPRP